MKIAVSNLMSNSPLVGAITATSDGSTDDPNKLLDSSFATKYNSAGSVNQVIIKYTFVVPTLLSYIGVAGHTAGIIGGNLQIFADGLLKISKDYDAPGSDDLFNDMSSVLMATFTPILITAVEVRLLKFNDNTDRLTLVNIQAGTTFTFPDPVNNSEEGGYIRPWLATGVQVKSILNRQSEPIVSLIRQKTKRVTLTINNLQDFTVDPLIQELFDFLDKITNETTFFVQERDGTVLTQIGEGNYLAFNTDVSMGASGSNRHLNTLKLAYDAYIGARD